MFMSRRQQSKRGDFIWRLKNACNMMLQVGTVRTLVRIWRNQKKTLLLTVVVGAIFLVLANTPYSLLYKHIHCHCSLLQKANDLNCNRMLIAWEYFTSMSPGKGFSEVRNLLPRKGANASVRERGIRKKKYNDRSAKIYPGRGLPRKLANKDAVMLGQGWSRNESNKYPYRSPAESVRGWNSPVRIAIAIVTMKRPFATSLGYVIQSAAALHSLLHQQSQGELFADSALFVCNVDSQPDQHADAVFLENYIPVVKRYGTSSRSITVNSSEMKIPGMKNVSYRNVVHKNVHNKEQLDYMFCLQSALHFRPEYVLMVEDDAVALPDMPAVMQHTLDRLAGKNGDKSRHTHQPLPSGVDSRNRPPEPSHRNMTQSVYTLDGDISPEQLHSVSSFVYLKLYFPMFWQGFAYEPCRLLDLLSMSTVLTTAVVGCLRVVLPAIRRRINFQRVVYMSVIFSLAAFVLIGRQNVIELRRLSKHFYRLQTSPDCCTPAVVYPRKVIPSLIRWLANCNSTKHVDICVSDFAKRSGLPAYNVEPNVFTHVGMVTSLKKRRKDPEELLFYHARMHFQVDRDRTSREKRACIGEKMILVSSNYSSGKIT